MGIIKEYCPDFKIAVIRTNTYAKGLSFLLSLFDEAKKDFPGLEKQHVEVKHYGGKRYKGTYGIEFKASLSNVPPSYRQIKELEFTL